MSLPFDRSVEVTITGGGESRTIAGLRVGFSVKKSRSGTTNTVTCQITNPAPGTEAAARDSTATIEIRAGYGGENVLLTRAEIDSAIVDRAPPDTVLDIQAQEGLRTLRETTVSISHASGSTVQTVLDEIVAATGFPVRATGADLSAKLGGGFAYVGKPSGALDELTARIKGSWSIQNGELQVLDQNGAVQGDEAVVLSPSTGMVSSPAPVETQTSSDKRSTDARKGYRVTSLLNAALEPGGLVDIRARDVEGVFVIDEVTHRGDNRGQDWYSEVTCYEADG